MSKKFNPNVSLQTTIAAILAAAALFDGRALVGVGFIFLALALHLGEKRTPHSPQLSRRDVAVSCLVVLALTCIMLSFSGW